MSMENSMLDSNNERVRDIQKMHQRAQRAADRALEFGKMSEITNRTGKLTRAQLERIIKDNEFKAMRKGEQPEKFSDAEIDELLIELNAGDKTSN